MTSFVTVVNTLRQDIACAVSLFTRLPALWILSQKQRAITTPWPLTRSLWCWPATGALTGLLCGITGWFLESILHIAALPAVTLALAALAVLTGAFHDDGLADMADSYGAHTRERKLDIMRDSRIGSYGVMALALSLITKAGALAAMPAGALIPALMCSGLMARTTLLWIPVLLRPARNDGLARTLSSLPRLPFLIAQVSAAGGIMLWATWWNTAFSPSLISLSLPIVAALLSLLFIARTAHKNLGGYTGDVLGATATLTECLVLAAMSASFSL